MVHMRKKITFKDIQVGDIIEVTHTNPGGTVTTTVGQADKIYQEEVTDSYGDTIAWSWEDEASVTCAECDHVGDDGYTRVPAEGYWYRTLVTSVRLRWR